jgi:hypothetical protein
MILRRPCFGQIPAVATPPSNSIACSSLPVGVKHGGEICRRASDILSCSIQMGTLRANFESKRIGSSAETTIDAPASRWYHEPLSRGAIWRGNTSKRQMAGMR